MDDMGKAQLPLVTSLGVYFDRADLKPFSFITLYVSGLHLITDTLGDTSLPTQSSHNSQARSMEKDKRGSCESQHSRERRRRKIISAMQQHCRSLK